MARAKLNKIEAFSILSEMVGRELIYGWNTTVPVDYKRLEKYKRYFEHAMSEDENFSEDSSNTGSTNIKKAYTYYNMLTDEIVDFFPKEKVDKFIKPLRENISNLENGEWYIEE